MTYMNKKKRLNIAIILPTIISKNGTAKQSLEFAIKLSKKGHNVSFYTFAYLKSTSFPEFKNFNLYFCQAIDKSIIFKFIKNVSILEQLYLYLGFIFISHFRKLFKNKDIDVLNPHDWFTIWVAGGLAWKSTPIIANINDVPSRLNGNLFDLLKLKIDRYFSKKISHIITLDNSNKIKVIKWLNISADKISVIRSGINLEKYKKFKTKLDLKKYFRLPKDSFLVACANLLAPNRRYEDVLYVLSELKGNYKKQLFLVILSKLDYNKKYANYLLKIINKNNLTNNIFIIDKFFSDYERMAYIKSCDMLIFPNYPQTWGLTVIESMALGVPVLVSNGAGVSEVLTDGVNSLLYVAGNTRMLKHRLMYALKNKDKLRLISKKGKEYVLNNFSWDKFTEKEEAIMYKFLYYGY